MALENSSVKIVQNRQVWILAFFKFMPLTPNPFGGWLPNQCIGCSTRAAGVYASKLKGGCHNGCQRATTRTREVWNHFWQVSIFWLVSNIF